MEQIIIRNTIMMGMGVAKKQFKLENYCRLQKEKQNFKVKWPVLRDI